MVILTDWELQLFRFYEDGTETGSTAIAAQNTNVTRTQGTDSANILLRIAIYDGTGSGGNATDDWQLQYNKNSAGWNDVTTSSSNVKGFDSSNLTDGNATTQRLTGASGTFGAGEICEDGLVDDLLINTSNNSELLYSLTVVYADLANNDTLDFRVLRNGSTMTYTVTPRITAAIPAGFTVEPVGKLTFNGIATQQTSGTYTPLGKLVFSGVASVMSDVEMQGALYFMGLAGVQCSYNYLASGKLLFTSPKATILYANGDGTNFSWVNEAAGSSNLYLSVDEGTGSPDDADYITSPTALDNITFLLTDTPSDFLSAIGIVISVRHNTSSSKGGANYVDEVQIVASDNTTAITNTAAATADTTITTYTYSPTITGTNTKASWDGARIRLRTRGSGTDGNSNVFALQVRLDYVTNDSSFSQEGSGALLIQGVASVANSYIYFPSGKLIFNGLAVARTSGVYAPLGQLTFNGLAVARTSGVYTPSGFLRLQTYAKLPFTNQWKLNEASGAALDSVGSFNISEVGSIGSASGQVGNCRTFGGSQYFSSTATDALAANDADFSFSVWFKATSYPGSSQQVICCRNAGSLDGNLAYILRTETSGTLLKLYIGLGHSNTFDVFTISGWSASNTNWNHFAVSFKNSTGAIRYRLNGGSVVALSTSNKPTTSGASLKFALGGETLELWSGSIDAVQFAASTVWDDTQLLTTYNNGVGFEDIVTIENTTAQNASYNYYPYINNALIWIDRYNSCTDANGLFPASTGDSIQTVTLPSGWGSGLVNQSTGADQPTYDGGIVSVNNTTTKMFLPSPVVFSGDFTIYWISYVFAYYTPLFIAGDVGGANHFGYIAHYPTFPGLVTYVSDAGASSSFDTATYDKVCLHRLRRSGSNLYYKEYGKSEQLITASGQFTWTQILVASSAGGSTAGNKIQQVVAVSSNLVPNSAEDMAIVLRLQGLEEGVLWFDEAVGQLTVNGIASVNVSYIYQPVGKLTFNGIESSRVSVIVEAVGKLTLNGIATGQTSGIYAPLGTLTFNGLSSSQITGIIVPLGQLTFNGIATGQISGIYAPLGTLTFNGLSSSQTTGNFIPLGQLTFNGIATGQTSGIYAPLGMLTFNGLSSSQTSGTFMPLGKLTFNGLASVVSFGGFEVEPTGQLVFTGLSTSQVSVITNALGSLIFNGLATPTAAIAFSPTGQLTLSGTAAPLINLNINGGGQLVFNGLCSTSITVITSSVGQLTFNGLSVNQVSVVVDALGKLTFDGLVTTSSNYVVNGLGKLTFDGVSFNQSSVVVNALGTLVLNGLANVQGSVLVNALGNMLFSGRATVSTESTLNVEPEGAIGLSGVALESTSGVFGAVGSLQFSGVLEIADYVYQASGRILIFDPRLFLWWKLEEGTGSAVANDSSAFWHQGQLINVNTATEWVAGNPILNFGNLYSLQMDGSDQYVTCDLDDLGDLDDGFSLSVWVNLDELPTEA